LWFGWYGFNPGSTLELHTADKAYTAGFVAVNTTISPCAAGLVVFLLRSLVLPPKILDVGAFCNGILAGLVAITAGCAVVKPWETLIIGAIAGVIYQATSMLMVKLKVDDVVDAFAVHGANGIWGVLALGFFGNPDEGMGGNGLFYGGDQLRTQVCALLVIIVWVGVLSILIFLSLKILKMLRLSDDLQTKGGDSEEQPPRKEPSPLSTLKIQEGTEEVEPKVDAPDI
jgi:Amt family ammonium transporter